MIRRLLVLMLLLAPLAAAAQSHVYLDRSMRAAPAARTVVLIPPDVAVSEISAGGVIEKVPEWSRQADEYVLAEVRKLAQGPRLRLTDLPALPADEQATLDQHVALYNLVAGNVLTNGLQGGEVWTKRLESGLTDYTIGPGLAFIADKTGADSALMIVVRDYESTNERKALMVLGALFGVGVPMGRTFAVAGLIDLRSGRLLWQSFDTNFSADLRVAADAGKLVEKLFASYPGAAAAAGSK